MCCPAVSQPFESLKALYDKIREVFESDNKTPAKYTISYDLLAMMFTESEESATKAVRNRFRCNMHIHFAYSALAVTCWR